MLSHSRPEDVVISPFQPGVAKFPSSNHGSADLTPKYPGWKPRVDEFHQSEADTAELPQFPVSWSRSDHLPVCIILRGLEDSTPSILAWSR